MVQGAQAHLGGMDFSSHLAMEVIATRVEAIAIRFLLLLGWRPLPLYRWDGFLQSLRLGTEDW